MDTFFGREVYIWLTDDETGFVCTVKYGKFSAMTTEFALQYPASRGVLNEKVLNPARKRSSTSARFEQF